MKTKRIEELLRQYAKHVPAETLLAPRTRTRLQARLVPAHPAPAPKPDPSVERGRGGATDHGQSARPSVPD